MENPCCRCSINLNIESNESYLSSTTWYLSQDWSAQLMAPIFTVGAQSFTSEAKSFQMGANLQWNSGHGGGVNKQALMRHGQTRLELTELLHSTATSDSVHTSGCRTGWSRWCLCCRSASCCRRRGWSRRSSGTGWCVRDSLQINFLAQISKFKMNQIKSSNIWIFFLCHQL